MTTTIYSGARSLLISRLALWCFLVVAVRESLAQERLIRFEQNERWGYKNSLGKVVIEPQFEIAEDFSAEGIAAVVDAKGWAYIDRKGNIVVRPFNYDNGPDPFQEGLARFVADDGKIGFFNKKGRPVIQPQFGSAFYFKEGLAAVCVKCREEVSGDARVIRGGKWGYINHKGEMVIKPQYDRAFPFEKGLAQVCLGCSEQTIGEHSIVTGGMWGSINKNGKVVVSFRARTELPRRLRPMRFLKRCVRAGWQRLPPTSNTATLVPLHRGRVEARGRRLGVARRLCRTSTDRNRNQPGRLCGSNSMEKRRPVFLEESAAILANI